MDEELKYAEAVEAYITDSSLSFKEDYSSIPTVRLLCLIVKILIRIERKLNAQRTSM